MRGVVAVACSGGRDSTALLHATAVAARSHGIDVVALHVHHGLLPQADAWLEHLRQQCEAWHAAGLPVRFTAHRLTGRPGRGESVEAWARQARYDALARMARDAGAATVLLGHHQRDQAETFLLQALRGAGVAGLSAMPSEAHHGGITWLRPWLEHPADAIGRYVRHHRLKHIEDDSNADSRFARNRLRAEVAPVLRGAFPQADQSLADAARWAQQASRLLAAIGADDLVQCADAQGLRLEAWMALDADRRANALRVWLQSRGPGTAPATLVQRLLQELPTSRGAAAWPAADGLLRRYRGRLRWVAEGRAPGRPAGSAEAAACPPRETTLSIGRAGRHRLPGWGGEIVAKRVREGGVPLAWLAQLVLAARMGSEQFQAGLGRPPRSLKKQYQAAGIPAWERGGPLVYSGGQLVFVPGLGLDARVIGLPGQPQMQLSWQPADDERVTGALASR